MPGSGDRDVLALFRAFVSSHILNLRLCTPNPCRQIFRGLGNTNTRAHDFHKRGSLLVSRREQTCHHPTRRTIASSVLRTREAMSFRLTSNPPNQAHSPCLGLAISKSTSPEAWQELHGSTSKATLEKKSRSIPSRSLSTIWPFLPSTWSETTTLQKRCGRSCVSSA
jgi:hypothetical protein